MRDIGRNEGDEQGWDGDKSGFGEGIIRIYHIHVWNCQNESIKEEKESIALAFLLTHI